MSASMSCGCGETTGLPSCLGFDGVCPFPGQLRGMQENTCMWFDGLIPGSGHDIDFCPGFGSVDVGLTEGGVGLTESGDGLSQDSGGFCPGSDASNAKACEAALTTAFEGAGQPDWGQCPQCRGAGHLLQEAVSEEQDDSCTSCRGTGVNPLQLAHLQEMARSYEPRALEPTSPLPTEGFWAAAQIPWDCIVCQGSRFLGAATEACPRCWGSGVFTP